MIKWASQSSVDLCEEHAGGVILVAATFAFDNERDDGGLVYCAWARPGDSAGEVGCYQGFSEGVGEAQTDTGGSSRYSSGNLASFG